MGAACPAGGGCCTRSAVTVAHGTRGRQGAPPTVASAHLTHVDGNWWRARLEAIGPIVSNPQPPHNSTWVAGPNRQRVPGTSPHAGHEQRITPAAGPASRYSGALAIATAASQTRHCLATASQRAQKNIVRRLHARDDCATPAVDISPLVAQRSRARRPGPRRACSAGTSETPRALGPRSLPPLMPYCPDETAGLRLMGWGSLQDVHRSAQLGSATELML
jgi:hypothetical protein